MTSQDIVELLACHPIFIGLPDERLKKIADSATTLSLKPRELVFQEDADATECYLILDGRVAIEIYTPDRGAVTIETVGSGDVLGWSWLIPPYQWHFDAKAVEETQALVLDATLLREMMNDSPEFGYQLAVRFVPVIVNRLQATRLQLLDLYNVHS